MTVLYLISLRAQTPYLANEKFTTSTYCDQNCHRKRFDQNTSMCTTKIIFNFLISLHFQCLESLIKDVSWHQFIIDLVLMSNVNEIRSTATDQFLLIATRCSGEQHPIRFFITLLFTQVILIDIVYLAKIIKPTKKYEL